MIAHPPEWSNNRDCCSDIPKCGHDQPYHDQWADPLRADRKISPGCLPANASGLERISVTCGPWGTAYSARRKRSWAHAGFEAPAGTVERRCAVDGGYHQVGKNHGIIMVESTILLRMGTQGIDHDIGQGTEPESRGEYA